MRGWFDMNCTSPVEWMGADASIGGNTKHSHPIRSHPDLIKCHQINDLCPRCPVTVVSTSFLCMAGKAMRMDQWSQPALQFDTSLACNNFKFLPLAFDSQWELSTGKDLMFWWLLAPAEFEDKRSEAFSRSWKTLIYYFENCSADEVISVADVFLKVDQ